MHALKKIILAIWLTLSFVRSLVFNLLFLFLLVVFISAIPGDRQMIIPDGAALLLTPQGTLVDQESRVDQLDILINNNVVAETSLPAMLESIRLAREDEYIHAIVLKLDELQSSGFSKLRELGRALVDFRESGKPVYAVADSFSQAQYYLASYADEILLNPMGAVELEGFSSYQPYYGEALSMLNVDIHLFRVGEYKSAGEVYTQNAMSEEARRNNQRWLDELWQLFLDDLAEQRSVAAGDLEHYVNAFDVELAAHAGNTAALARASNLVDRVMTRQETRDYLREQLGTNRHTNTYPNVDLQTYRNIKARTSNKTPAGDKVGVIVANGTIYDGRQRPGNIGGDTLSELIRHARENEEVKALVLRIDSPGGSAFASEVIRQELLAFKASGKALVVSMGSVAASGGYWIATVADQILASPATITGSIGIYSIFPTIDRSLNSIGINFDGIASTGLAGQYTGVRPLPEVTENAIQESLQHGYRQFLEVVAEGRQMDTETVDEMGRGQVWSGQQALALGLVDAHGNLEDAVTTAAELANVEDYTPLYIKQTLSPFEQFLNSLGKNVNLPEIGSNPGGLLSLFQRLNTEVDKLLQANDPRGMYLQCLECMFW